MPIDWSAYQAVGIWDELVTDRGRPRAGAAELCRMLSSLTDDELLARKTAAEVAIRTMGITFTVYTGEGSGSIDREWPFDIIPRLLLKREWDVIADGLKQRVDVLNRFIDDIYHEQKVLHDNIVPRAL